MSQCSTLQRSECPALQRPGALGGGERRGGEGRGRERGGGGRRQLRPGGGGPGCSPPQRWGRWQPAAGAASAARGDPVLPRCARPLRRALLSWRSQDGGPGLHPGQAGDQLLLQREERQGAGAGRRPAARRLPRRLTPLPSEAKNCLIDKHIVFLGDSRIRQLFYSFIKIINPQIKEEGNKHGNIPFEDKSASVKVDFLWYPEVNGSMRQRIKSWTEGSVAKPHIIVAGAATWSIKIHNGSNEALAQYKINITSIAPLLEKLAKSSDVYWILQDPVYEDLLSESRKMITNEKIDAYNEAAVRILNSSSRNSKAKVKVFSVSKLIAQETIMKSSDGLHLPESSRDTNAMILMNVYCNKIMKPIDGSCCQPQPPLTLIQKANLFMKENKFYTHSSFFIPIIYILVLGVFYTENTKEFLPVYMHIRVLVAAYLFQTGYGHFSYFWIKGDFGVYRVCQGAFEKVFSFWPLSKCFELNGNVYEWWFRWKLDRYVVFHGMLFAFIYLALQKHQMISEGKGDPLFSSRVSNVLLFISIVSFLTYSIWASSCKNKAECNELHPSVSVVQILAFILIRNIPGYVRSVYSSFFAWFGKISLELFICQYHIWLAADTKGILVLIPGYPMFNVIVSTFIFVCVAHEISQITNDLAQIVVPKDNSTLLKRLLCIAGFFSGLLFFSAMQEQSRH
uniref:N-acetylneuraminate (7)9-O-acetyltransferase n=1 Tax=Coturnix japonica TaxID=93934 RepID=A0A8C2TGU8_COTJA